MSPLWDEGMELASLALERVGMERIDEMVRLLEDLPDVSAGPYA